MELVDSLFGFMIFVILQSFFINGVHYSFSKGNVFYLMNPIFFEKHKEKRTWWSLPIWLCIRCMASVWGLATFWPVAIGYFGFNVVEIPICIFDVVVLVSLNWIVYKKLN